MTGVDLDLLIRLSAALSARDHGSVELTLRALAAGGEAGRMAVEEVILQSYLFLGYPAALNGFALWRAVSGHRAGPAVPDDPGLWMERGAGVCSTVYGRGYLPLRANIQALHPDMERWMVMEGYGKVLGRPGVDLAVRELCIVAILSVQGVVRQLHSHLRGALNAGAPPGAVDAALEIAGEFQTPEGRAESRGIWAKVLQRWQEVEEVKTG